MDYFHRILEKTKESSATIILFIAIFFFWEFYVRIFNVQLYILPPPSLIFSGLIENIALIWEYSLVSMTEAYTGFFIALVISIPLSLMIAFSKLLMSTVFPSFITLEMVPKIAFAPLFIIWFGLGSLSKLLVVFLVCFFPIIINGIFGFSSLSQDHEYLITSTGASKMNAFFKIRLPAALPSLFVGIKGAAIAATIGATIAEWVSGNSGLGYYIQVSSANFKMDMAIAAIIMLTIIGLVLYWFVLMVEKLIIPWHESQRR